MRRWRAFLLAALWLLALTACGAQGEPVPPEDPAPAEDETPTETPLEEEAMEEEESVFEQMPGAFLFCSGAGAWSTELSVTGDGTFTGYYHDSDMGVTGEGFPDGTVYVCGFQGAFGEPEQVEETVWQAAVTSLELDHPDDGTEELAEGQRYIYSGPYGLEGARTVLVYGPETPAEDLPEDFLSWVRGPYDWEPTPEGTLGLWGLYNVEEGYGFVQYPYGLEGG